MHVGVVATVSGGTRRPARGGRRSSRGCGVQRRRGRRHRGRRRIGFRRAHRCTRRGCSSPRPCGPCGRRTPPRSGTDARADFGRRQGAVVVELGQSGHWDESSTSTLSSSVLLELAREVAFEAGMEDAHVSLDGHHRLRLTLGDHGTATQAILDAFWRRGIVADATLVGRSHVALRRIRSANSSPARRHAASERIRGALGLDREGFHAEQDGSAQAVFALSDGVIGSSGAPLGDAPGANRRGARVGRVHGGRARDASARRPDRVAPAERACLEDAPLRRALDFEPAWFTRSSRRRGGAIAACGSRRSHGRARPCCARRSRRSRPVPFCSRRPRARPSTVERWTRRTGYGQQVTPAGSSPPAFSNSSDPSSTGVAASTASLPITLTRTTCRTRPRQSTAYERRLESGSTACSTSTVTAWSRRWEDADVVIDGDDELQTATRFALFHLMGSAGDRGETAVGARGLSGPGYRGHVFWDADTFVLPFLAATHPPATRSMLEYRIRRLPAAIEAARAGRTRRRPVPVGVGTIRAKK